jgi:hypothetical protein
VVSETPEAADGGGVGTDAPPLPSEPTAPQTSAAEQPARRRVGLRQRDVIIVLLVLVVVLGVVVVSGWVREDDDGGTEALLESIGTGVVPEGPPTDSFDRPDSVSSVGVATNGDSWDAVDSTWGIAGGQLAVAEPAAGDANGFVLLDMGSGDGTVAATNVVVRGGSGLVFRYTSPTDYWVAVPAPDYGTWVVQHRRDGETPVSENVGLASTADGAQVRVDLDGDRVTVQAGGSEPLVIQDDGGQDASVVGVVAGGYGSNGARWDNFYAIPA